MKMLLTGFGMEVDNFEFIFTFAEISNRNYIIARKFQLLFRFDFQENRSKVADG